MYCCGSDSGWEWVASGASHGQQPQNLGQLLGSREYIHLHNNISVLGIKQNELLFSPATT